MYQFDKIGNGTPIMGAIWAPYFSTATIKKLLVLFIIPIFILAFMPPNHAESPLDNAAYQLASKLPAVKSLCSDSHFPFACGITYTFALLASFCMAIFSGFTEVNVRPFLNIAKNISSSTRVIYFCGVILVICSLTLLDSKPNEYQISYRFFRAISEYRVILCFFSMVIYLGNFMLWFLFFYEITSLFKFLFIRRSK